MRQFRALCIPRSLRVLFVGALVAVAPACGSDGGSEDAGAGDAPLAPDAAVALDGGGAVDGGLGSEEAGAASTYCTSKSADPSATSISGTWVARVVGAQVVNALGSEMRNQTNLYLLINLSQQGTGLVAEGRYCDREQVNHGGLISVLLPDRWAHTETPVHRTGSFTIGEGGAPVLEWDTLSEVYGAVLVPPDDTLPTSRADPRIVDEDGDGNPGISIAVTGPGIAGNLYVVQRLTTAVRAIAVAPNRFEGALIFTSEQNVLDTSSPTLTVLYSSSGGVSRADPILCNSGFTMVRIDPVPVPDAGMLSCEWVRANEAVLFPE